jgi:hypothetical protein
MNNNSLKYPKPTLLKQIINQLKLTINENHPAFKDKKNHPAFGCCLHACSNFSTPIHPPQSLMKEKDP